MKLGSRLLLGTLATTAALGGSAVNAAGAQAAAGNPGPAAGPAGPSATSAADDGSPLDTNTLLCPVAASGFIGEVVNGLNKESIDRSCGGLRKNSTGGPLGLL